jgi:hypothetical protein
VTSGHMRRRSRAFPVMLNPFVELAGNSAKQLSTHCARPFAAPFAALRTRLRVTQARHSWNRRLPRLIAPDPKRSEGCLVNPSRTLLHH